MVRNARVILDELAKGIEELRDALAPSAGRAGPTASVLTETNDLKKIVSTVERLVIERVMRKVRGNQLQGALLLNISRGGLIAKLKQYRIEDFRYLKRREKGRSELSRPTASRGGPRQAVRTAKATTTVGTKPSAATRRAPSRKLNALRALQGKFLGTLNRLKPRQREQIKKIRAEKGYDAAIKAAASLGK